MKLKSTALMFSASLLALSTASAALAQNAPAQPAAKADDVQEVIVVGARRAEQSAINRKKKAATTQDSIVADDVGNFPDKNIGDAIARIAGVALDVSDSGEPGGFAIRGQSADLIRVEVDGMSMLATNSQDGRSVTGLADMSSDLIKSVDVVKGQTADMTPGGVGGTVRIEQRSGLDFAKPLYKFNLQYQQTSLDGGWSPRANIVATRKFLGGRLGLLFNLTYDQQVNVSDIARVSNSSAGYIPLGDYDNSPEKSFTQAFDPIAAAVTTKSGCAALSTVQGINSRLNCYAQWEDFFPSLPRFSREYRDDRTTSLQLRADYRVNDNLTVFFAYNPNIRDFKNTAYNLQIASPTGTTNTSGVLTSANVNNVKVNENHFVTQYDMIRGTAAGNVSSLVWDSQVRNLHRITEQHYVQAGADWKWNNWIAKGRIQYAASKADRQDDTIKIFAQLPSVTFKMVPESGLWTYEAPASVNIFSPSSYYPVAASNGLSATSAMEYTPFYDENSEWNYQLDVTRNFDNFGPIKTVKFGIQQRERHNQTWRYDGFQIKPGVTLYHARSLDVVRWCNPATAPASAPCVFGTTPIPTTTLTNVPYKNHTLTQAQYNSIIDSAVVRLPGATYFNGVADRGNLLESWMVPNFDTFYNLLSQYADLSGHNSDCLFRCLASDGKVYERPTYSTEEGTTSAYLMTDFETRLFGVEVLGNVGVRYQKVSVQAAPSIVFYDRDAVAITGTNTTTGLPTKGYQLADTFVSRRVGNVDRTSEDFLPSLNLAAWPIEDQLAVRFSIAKQRARPTMTNLTGTSASSCYKVDPTDREALEAFLAQNPGAFDDGDSTTDDGSSDDNFLANQFINRCTGRIGNPELKGYEAITQNLSVEWYPNKDSQFSVTAYSIDVKTGRPEEVTLSGYELEGNTYTVATYKDGEGGLKFSGLEIAGRTAFSFLPGLLRYTGGGFNYTSSEASGATSDYDYFSGKYMPPKSQSKTVYNINLWYDDGRLNARVAYQWRDDYYSQISAQSVNRIPTGYGIDGTTTTTAYFKTVHPVFKTGAQLLDARASYKLNPKLQFFIEGKNLLNDTITRYAPEDYIDLSDSDTPYVYDQVFNGRRIYVGIITTF
ncbi:TonB-dependent receptor [Asticcacaulis excentricus]|nr:TonB-dependent receptor [Asticcacaulis excentricus]